MSSFVTEFQQSYSQYASPLVADAHVLISNQEPQVPINSSIPPIPQSAPTLSVAELPLTVKNDNKVNNNNDNTDKDNTQNNENNNTDKDNTQNNENNNTNKDNNENKKDNNENNNTNKDNTQNNENKKDNNTSKDHNQQQDTAKVSIGPKIHPYHDRHYYENHPPVPLLNVIIDNYTGQIIEDKTGQT
jgi:hypothetical protein